MWGWSFHPDVLLQNPKCRNPREWRSRAVRLALVFFPRCDDELIQQPRWSYREFQLPQDSLRANFHAAQVWKLSWASTPVNRDSAMPIRADIL